MWFPTLTLARANMLPPNDALYVTVVGSSRHRWRVPLFLVSPWTRGNYVYSEVGVLPDAWCSSTFSEKPY